ncbi:MAG: hypothetical protein UW24_C0009G0007 [Parcubacteria group bacterium GW2011_GWA2_44_12]|nr:MAG: hypothetical protein UW24_C0009G0007 [Parcubacteria group bacterium GW2011_GWA2_44_12]
MSQLIFDIETIGEDFDALDKTTQENLSHWIDDQSFDEDQKAREMEFLKSGMGFSPLTGEIVVIGMLDYEKQKGAIYFQAPNVDIEDFEEDGFKFRAMSEMEMLAKFWEGARQYKQFVSFNGRAFDAPFLLVRSAIHKIKPTVNLMPNRYLQNSSHIDLFDQLTFYGAVRKKGSLHLWSRAFGIQSPKAGGVSGDEVTPMFKAGKFLDIAHYNRGDLRATRDLYEYWKEYINFSTF